MWSVEYLNEQAEAEIEALPKDLRASFQRIAGMIRASGLERVGTPYVKHVEGKVWEMRLSGRTGIARSLYVTAVGKRVVVLRTFVKKTQKAPRREIELARERAKEVR